MTYSHRNGETEPPTITEAWFWFVSDDDAEISAMGMFFIHLDGELGDNFDDPRQIDELDRDSIFPEQLKGRWWGPVTPPWEDAP